MVAVLLAFPYLLMRFLDSLEALPPRARRAADALTAAVVVATAALPRIPATRDHRRPWWLAAFLALVVVEWGWLSGYACFRLLWAGRGQPTVVRRRMQCLSLASFVLVLSLIPALSTSNGEVASAAHVASEVIGLLAGLLFCLGMAPPAVLRILWRRPEETALRDAEIRLMGGAKTGGVALAVLPHVPRLFGGRMAVLIDRDGELLGAHGADERDVAGLRAGLAAHRGDDEPFVMRPGIVAVPLRTGLLAVETGAYTPFFAREEVDLLRNLAAFVDLALARAVLFEREHEARVALEAAHQELEDLVYSLSHDLKSPLISLLGYLDYLGIDCGDALGETGSFYVARMTASATYMTSLIEDLLSLSRVGRTEAGADDVDLSAVLAEVVATAVDAFPAAAFDVGPLPTVRINALRARELFTNLVDNAVKHGGRDDLRVSVHAQGAEDGGVAVVVGDDGQGIPAAYREKVFGIFERLGAGVDGDAGGTGIGLAMCRKIVEQWGGTIAIVDDAEEANMTASLLPSSSTARPGTVVRVVFPAEVVRAVPAAVGGATAMGGATVRGGGLRRGGTRRPRRRRPGAVRLPAPGHERHRRPARDQPPTGGSLGRDGDGDGVRRGRRGRHAGGRHRLHHQRRHLPRGAAVGRRAGVAAPRPEASGQGARAPGHARHRHRRAGPHPGGQRPGGGRRPRPRHPAR